MEKPFNAPVKNCATCAHIRLEPFGQLYNKCARYGFHFCLDTIKVCQMNEWQPRPPKTPRRSLRQWLIDTFWKTE